MNMRNTASKLTSLLLCLTLVICAVAYFKKAALPDHHSILPGLAKDPIQKGIKEKDFPFAYGDKTYVIQPVAQYELWGLVVSHNDIAEFSDIYHTKNSVDIKDLCVIWGDNIATDDYKRIKFWSEPFSCQFYTNSPVVLRTFERTQIANNHLLSEDERVREQIREAHVGDQIHFKGRLVNYYPQQQSEAVRKTSTTRQDTGNGACEVVLVDQFEILKKANAGWWKLFRASEVLLVVLVVAKVGVFLLSVYSRL
jgi:hypothetical protein